MQHVRFGRTGLQVSRLCLGTMTFGLQCDEKTSHAILDSAADGGITFLDAADVYPLGSALEDKGRTEEIVGRWLRGKRDKFVLATKCGGKAGPARWQQGTSRKHVLAAIDAVVKSGKARYVGVSKYLAYRVARALGRSEALGRTRLVSVQPRYNLLFRQIERELLPLCQEEGLAVIPYNPLAGGLLTGKHARTAPLAAGSRFTLGTAGTTYVQRYWKEREFNTVDAFVKLAAEAGLEPATLAVAWVLAHPAVTAPLVGASKPNN
jgi:aryl-alcohol dehydrogenase (NADP+)